MLEVKFSDAESYEALPVAKYIARMDQIVAVTDLPFGDGSGLQWTFTVVDNRTEKQQYKGRTVRGLSGMVASPKAKLTSWLAAMGIFMDADQNKFDIHTLYGTYVVINVVNTVGKDKKTGEEKVYANVDAIISVPKQLEPYIDTTVPTYNPQSKPSQFKPQSQAVRQTSTPAPQRSIQHPTSPATQPITRPAPQPQAQQPDPSELISDEDINF